MYDKLEKKTYWCISRQRVWGLPIPVFYNKHTDEPVLNRYGALFDYIAVPKLIHMWFIYILVSMLLYFRNLNSGKNLTNNFLYIVLKISCDQNLGFLSTCVPNNLLYFSNIEKLVLSTFVCMISWIPYIYNGFNYGLFISEILNMKVFFFAGKYLIIWYSCSKFMVVIVGGLWH